MIWISHLICCNLQRYTQTSVSCSASQCLGSLPPDSFHQHSCCTGTAFLCFSIVTLFFLLASLRNTLFLSFIFPPAVNLSLCFIQFALIKALYTHIREPWVRQGGQKNFSFLFETPNFPLYLNIIYKNVWTSSPVLSSVGQCVIQK